MIPRLLSWALLLDGLDSINNGSSNLFNRFFKSGIFYQEYLMVNNHSTIQSFLPMTTLKKEYFMVNNHSTIQSFLPMTTLKKSASALSVCLLAALNLNAPQSVAKEQNITDSLLQTFETTVETAMATYNVPGVAIAIVEGNDIVYGKGFGWRNRENQEPVTPNTRFSVGSMTKPMTSTMVATMVDDGLLSWKEPVVNILPDFVTLPTDELTRKLKVRHLMQMNTGLGEENPFTTFYNMKLNGFSAEDVLDSLATLPIVAPLGKVYYPNNNVFSSAGFIAALASGTPYGNLFNGYHQLMQERIFNPIGMESPRFTIDLPTVGDEYATSYAFNLVTNTVEPLSFYPNPPNTQGYAPSGSISAHALDVARYLITQLNKGVAPDDTRIVSVKNLRKTQQPKMEITDHLVFSTAYPLAESIHYGTGWVIAKQVNGVKMIGHSGGLMGFTSTMAFIPDADVGIVILTNRNFLDPFLSSVHFIGVVRDSLFELLYQLEPTVAEKQANAYQYRQQTIMPPIPVLRGMMQTNFTPDSIAPYLGNYEKGWKVERRDDGTLWAVLQDAHENQLVLLPDGTFLVSNNSFFGTPVHFLVDYYGNIIMTMTVAMITTGTLSTEVVAKID
jgi:CubicO group peptidase (beta-lactamase class C family)